MRKDYIMATGVKHYKRNGTLFTGKMHRMDDGSLHSGANHTSKSVKLYHYRELSKTAKAKALKAMK